MPEFATGGPISGPITFKPSLCGYVVPNAALGDAQGLLARLNQAEPTDDAEEL